MWPRSSIQCRPDSRRGARLSWATASALTMPLLRRALTLRDEAPIASGRGRGLAGLIWQCLRISMGAADALVQAVGRAGTPEGIRALRGWAYAVVCRNGDNAPRLPQDKFANTAGNYTRRPNHRPKHESCWPQFEWIPIELATVAFCIEKLLSRLKVAQTAPSPSGV